MTWIAVGVGGAALIGGVASGAMNSSAAGKAANAQEYAAQLQEQEQAGVTNAELELNAPTRALAGEAQGSLAYLLGLSPDLNQTPYNITPQISPTGQVTYVNAQGAPISPNGQLLGPNGYPLTNTGAEGNSSTPLSAYAGTAPGFGGTPQLNPNAGGTPSANITMGGGTGTQTATPTQGLGGSGVPLGPTATGVTPSGTGPGYGSLVSGPDANSVDLQMNPDYKFVLNQNEEQIQQQEAAAGQGQGSIGALKNAMNYATGLAGTTYETAFGNAVTNQTNEFDRLASIAGEGQQATAGETASLESGGAGIAGAEGAAGSAASAGAIGAGNAITSGIGTGLSGINTAAYLNGLNNNSNSYGGGGSNGGIDLSTSGIESGYTSYPSSGFSSGIAPSG